tara:strand:+ start:464 stop:691 length:228 start_codon:yes stop_codon:yes gene_type:complete
MKVRRKTKNILVTLPVKMIEKLDRIRDETEFDRSEVLEALLKGSDVLNDDTLIDDLFGIAEEDGVEGDEEEDEED